MTAAFKLQRSFNCVFCTQIKQEPTGSSGAVLEPPQAMFKLKWQDRKQFCPHRSRQRWSAIPLTSMRKRCPPQPYTRQGSLWTKLSSPIKDLLSQLRMEQGIAVMPEILHERIFQLPETPALCFPQHDTVSCCAHLSLPPVFSCPITICSCFLCHPIHNAPFHIALSSHFCTQFVLSTFACSIYPLPTLFLFPLHCRANEGQLRGQAWQASYTIIFSRDNDARNHFCSPACCFGFCIPPALSMIPPFHYLWLTFWVCT